MAENLRKALETFGPNGENWANGYPMPMKQCAWTACESMATASFLRQAGGFDNHHDLFVWNDAPERTFADVKNLFEKAIAKAEKPHA